MIEMVLIIGSGPAGLTAAIYTARANLNPVLYEGFQAGGIPGGQLMTTGKVENYPGFPDGIDGQALMNNMRKQAENFGTRFIMDDVVDVNLSKRPFIVFARSGEQHGSESLIISTGASARRLSIPSENTFWGKGISACAVCDGALPVFRNKELAVIGGGDAAIEEACHLTHFGTKVYIIHRRNELRASKIMQKRALQHPKIEILWNKVVTEFLGDKLLAGIKLKDTQSGITTELSVAGAFEAIGHIPNTAFLRGQLTTDNNGYIITQPDSTKTSVEGVFAAGDAKDSKFRQASTAVGSGCVSAIECERWLSGIE